MKGSGLPEEFLNTPVEVGGGDIPFKKPAATARPGAVGLQRPAIAPPPDSAGMDGKNRGNIARSQFSRGGNFII
jgi:hypothetical protein